MNSFRETKRERKICFQITFQKQKAPKCFEKQFFPNSYLPWR